jgi:hypothetical protein
LGSSSRLRDSSDVRTGGEDEMWLFSPQMAGGRRRQALEYEILRRASILFGELDPPHPLIVAFIDEMKAAGFAVESICRVLREQGCQVAART